MRRWVRNCLPAWLVGGTLAFFAAFIAGPALVPVFMPMARYYDIRSITVSDTVPGVAPRVIVDRTIRQNFRGRRDVEILRAEGGEFVVWWDCGPHGTQWRPYRTNEVLPAGMNLDWWMDIPPNRACPLPAGTYKVTSTIYAKSWLGAELVVTVDSNVFKVAEETP